MTWLYRTGTLKQLSWSSAATDMLPSSKKGTSGLIDRKYIKPPVGFEPTTSALQKQGSAVELKRQIRFQLRCQNSGTPKKHILTHLRITRNLIPGTKVNRNCRRLPLTSF